MWRWLTVFLLGGLLGTGFGVALGFCNGRLGPGLPAGCLALIPDLMLGLGWDPNYAEVARGVIIIAVVMIGGLLQVRRKRLR